MQEPELDAERLEAVQSPASDPGPARGAVAGRAAGVAGESEPARRLMRASPSAPRPASPEASPTPAAAVQAPAKAMSTPQDALQDLPAAPAPEPPEPAAAPLLERKAEQLTAPAPAPPPAREALGESLPKGAATTPTRGEMQAGQAADERLAAPTQIASDAPTAPAEPAGGIGGAGHGLGGGAAPAAAAGSRDNIADFKEKAVDKAPHPAAAPLSALGLAPGKRAEPAAVPESESLARSRTAVDPAAEQRLFRQYATRELAGVSAEQRSASAATVYWEPLLVTDAEGRASIRFRLPETPTTYRVLVDGHGQGRIGSYLGRIVVQPESKPGAD